MQTMKLEGIGFYTLSDARAANVSTTSQMQRGEIIINEYCNFKCPYCKGLVRQIFQHRKKKELTVLEIQRIIDYWCINQPIKNIRFSGGEPTYHKDITSIVEYARLSQIGRIAISTNGSNTRQLYEDLINAGCNDFSISLDAADPETGDLMAGGIPGAWHRVVENISWIAQRTYTTVGVVLSPENIERFIEIVEFADSLGVADIRVIPSAQWNMPLPKLTEIRDEILNRHPILKYRVNNFIKGKRIRGLSDGDVSTCPLVLDDSAIAGEFHYPCIIYMREGGTPIGQVHANMRADRVRWYETTNTHRDMICKNNCLDVCVDYNKKAQRAIECAR